jgi:hypothetical protein
MWKYAGKCLACCGMQHIFRQNNVAQSLSIYTGASCRLHTKVCVSHTRLQVPRLSVSEWLDSRCRYPDELILFLCLYLCVNVCLCMCVCVCVCVCMHIFVIGSSLQTCVWTSSISIALYFVGVNQRQHMQHVCRVECRSLKCMFADGSARDTVAAC